MDNLAATPPESSPPACTKQKPKGFHSAPEERGVCEMLQAQHPRACNSALAEPGLFRVQPNKCICNVRQFGAGRRSSTWPNSSIHRWPQNCHEKEIAWRKHGLWKAAHVQALGIGTRSAAAGSRRLNVQLGPCKYEWQQLG